MVPISGVERGRIVYIRSFGQQRLTGIFCLEHIFNYTISLFCILFKTVRATLTRFRDRCLLVKDSVE